jgi:solute carrier family 25 protein 34/35
MIGQFEGFLISALAPAIAVVFTNPFDTVKVRLQLQGQAGNTPAKIKYLGTTDAITKIFKNEGIKGLQKGLTPAILREGSKNFFRIGMFDPIMSILHNPKDGRAPGWKRALAGSLCGVMGALSCNPFELVKTRLQSAAKVNAVGHQYQYTGTWSALKSIYKADGMAGLYRGSTLSIGRSVIGSGANLASFSLMKEYFLVELKWKDTAVLDMICGLSSGAVSVIFMNPIDVIRTRFYNQPYKNGKGELYSSGADAIKKIFRNEGPKAFYKGITTHFLRIGPHFCRTLKLI